uniref:Cytochrome P450 n=1 Tax=Opuntia streptacantha TaxID=393608 RepID=A0A7C9A8W7_OPUST
MEFFQQFLLATMATFLSSFIISLVLKNFRNQTQKKIAPESGGAWPIVGHLPLLGASRMPHKVLAAMADTYGPIFTMWFGVNQALVISSSELARECLLTNDKVVLGRTKYIAAELLCYNYAMFGFGPHGSYWRHMRKLVMRDLLSNHRLDMLSHVWKSEVKMFVNDLYTLWSTNKSKSSTVLVDLKQRFSDLAMNIIFRIIFGKKFVVGSEEGKEIKEAIREFMEHTGLFVIGDALPFLRWMDLGGQEKAMKRNFKKLDHILQGWLDEHKQKRSKDDQDFMDVMLQVLDHEPPKDCNYDADTINKATCLTITTGGSDTTPIILTWAISLLLNNPHILKRAQDELTQQVGKDRQVDESDIPRLVYLQAIVKETMRLYPPAPLIVREFIQDSIIGGYNFRTGTKLMVNLHKISREPKIWEDPLEFRPERFLTTHKDVDFRGKHFEFIPFGAGRRVCPGLSFGVQVVHLALASFLHAFELSTPSGAPVDMSERFGLTNIKAEPLEVLIAPALSSKAYSCFEAN